MTLSTVFQHGASNGGADKLALFVKLATGEVITAFRRDAITMGMPFPTRAVQGGQTAQFRVTARTNASGHERGDWVLSDSSAFGGAYLKNPNVAEVVIGLDRALVSGAFFDELDDIMAPDAQAQRTEFAFQAGEAIAREYDFRRFASLISGALLADNYNTSKETGTVIDAGTGTFGKAVVAETLAEQIEQTKTAVRQMAAQFDKKFVPRDQRFMAVGPDEYYWMIENLRDDIINVDYRGEGSIARGEIFRFYGFEIVKSTNIPGISAALASYTAPGADGTNSIHPVNIDGYGLTNSDAANSGALFFHPSALGIVHPASMGADPVVYAERHEDRLGTVVFAKAYSGSKCIRPEATGLIRCRVPA